MTAVVFMILELQPRYYNVSDMSMRSPADCGVIAANCYNYNYKQPSISRGEGNIEKVFVLDVHCFIMKIEDFVG